MNAYNVNASVTFSAWVYIPDADSEADALEQAHGMKASDFDYDPSTGEVEFNVTPTVEEMPF